MTIYIARNGEKIGPLSLEQAKRMAQNGNVSPNDLAWYEGLPTWIPLSQVPGFAVGGVSSAPLPPPERPVLVWVISILFFMCIPCNGLCIAINPILQKQAETSTNELQRRFMESQGLFNYYLPSIIGMIVALVWIIQFFRLKRSSFWFLVGYLGISVLQMLITFCDRNYLEMINESAIVATVTWGMAGMVWAMMLAILYYNWYLLRKGTLR